MSKIWVAVDPGEKRIGVARSDPLAVLARPMAIVDSPEALLALIQEWHEDEPLAGMIVGLPRNMDGSIGPIARRSFPLVHRLREELPLEVRFWDERLTTRQVERARDARGDRARGPLDDQAAAVLLQSYLDAGTPAAADPAEYPAEYPAEP